MSDAPPSATPFLMFQGNKAKAAIDFYQTVFPSTTIEHIVYRTIDTKNAAADSQKNTNTPSNNDDEDEDEDDDTKVDDQGTNDTTSTTAIQTAMIVLAGQRIMISDSPIDHDFTFTPSISFFVECENEAIINERFTMLSSSNGSKVMMPLDNYGFSQKFAWISDPFGISWQLNLK